MQDGGSFFRRQRAYTFDQFPFKIGRVHDFRAFIQKFGKRNAKACEQLFQNINGRLIFAPFDFMDVIF